VKKFLSIIILSSLMVVSSISSASIPNNINNYPEYDKDTIKLYKQVYKLKDKYFLEFKSEKDLLETCQIITKYAEYSNFDEYDVATIVLKESRFDQFALNKSDGGKGYGQITRLREWHKETLFWVTDIYDKDQNIKAIYIVLEDNLKCRKNKSTAIRNYNGFGASSFDYLQDFKKKRKELKNNC